MNEAGSAQRAEHAVRMIIKDGGAENLKELSPHTTHVKSWEPYE
jgi:hypothetical protein